MHPITNDLAVIIFPRLIIVLVAMLGPCLPLQAAPKRPKPQEWRVLLIVKARGDISAEGFPPIAYQMSRTDIAAVKVAFTDFTADFVKTLSRGRLVWKADVVVSPTPLTKVAKLGDGHWISPECVSEDIAMLAPPGKYDGVFVYWKDSDDTTRRNVKGGFGWTHAAPDGYKGVGYSCVNFVPARDLGRDSEWTEVFLHEWLHQLEAFYNGMGVKLPRGGLHGNDNYGFKHKGGWKHWYEAFINAELVEPDGTRVGLGESAWRRGTFRDEQLIRLPLYLTPQRRRANLLSDGSFEDGRHDWTDRSWRGNASAAAIVSDVHKSGTSAIILRSPDADDAMFSQKVTVKPRTRYLLSGWARTENVVVQQEGGTIGANLSVAGSFECTDSLVGTTGWTYLALVLASGDRTEIDVGARLGHHGSTASGTAWFDDLVLIEIPEPQLSK